MIVSRREVLKCAGGVVAAAPLFGLTAVCAAGRRDGEARLGGATMGTSWSVTIADPPAGFDRAAVQARIERVLELVNEQMSTFRPGSELSRFNASAGEDWFEVSRDTLGVIEEALRVSRLSGGAFDPTVGPLVNAWGFGPPGPGSGRPDPARIAELLQSVDYRAIRTRTAPAAIARNRPGVCIDLCGVAKGFGLDRIAVVLDQAGLDRYLIEIGGELRGRGAWRAGIERPVPGEGVAVCRVVRLEDRALATSGDYRSFFERDGVRYSHLIDPRTGWPVAHGLASVSVIADTAMRADAMSTTLMVLGLDAGWQLARQQRVAAMFIGRRGGGLIERHTPEFDQFVEGDPK